MTNPWTKLYNYIQSAAGILGLASIFRDVIEWQHLFVDMINAWATFSRPIAVYLFGWIFGLLEWPLSDWLKDYLIVCAIFSGAHVRVYYWGCRSLPNMTRNVLRTLLVARSVEDGIQLDDMSISKAEQDIINQFLSDIDSSFAIAFIRRSAIVRHAAAIPVWIVGFILWPLTFLLIFISIIIPQRLMLKNRLRESGFQEQAAKYASARLSIIFRNNVNMQLFILVLPLIVFVCVLVLNYTLFFAPSV